MFHRVSLLFFYLLRYFTRVIEFPSEPLLDASRLYEERVRATTVDAPSTSRNHNDGASKSRNARFVKTIQRAARSNKRGACIMYPLVHEGPRVIPHKYAPINARNFHYLWPGARRNLVAATFRRCIYLLFPQRG